ncbi:MAG: type IV secretion system DNA-binding domain-containing protein, partial [Rickettsiaceae bacterium]|nr:type IV secretion system DNA-binding domain-containing protein [Rickettsiaceae bacterium]
DFSKLDASAIVTYRKAVIADALGDVVSGFRVLGGKNRSNNITIDAKTKNGIYIRNAIPTMVMKSRIFEFEDEKFQLLLRNMLSTFCVTILSSFSLIFLIWSKFGLSIKSEKKIKGGEILSGSEVRNILRKLNLASSIMIGKLPLVKNSETRHFLICGATGSGKTNLVHNILRQVEQQKKPAMIIDTTGEMVEKYYNPARGDIIFNPFDNRGKNWNFWKDCCSGPSTSQDGVPDRLKKFSEILFHFRRRQGAATGDPFWDQAAEKVFNSISTKLFAAGTTSYKNLYHIVNSADIKELRQFLKDTPAFRYLSDEGKGVSTSVTSVLATSSSPLAYLSDDGESFSLVEYFKSVSEGRESWLFFASPVHQREVLMPLMACLTELATSMLMELGPNDKRRFWTVIDELAALGNLPAMDILLREGRKYGACVIAGLQSVNQLYKNYGQYAGSTIFGQFATKFFFKTDEPVIAGIISSMCGTQVIHQQKKNISFGANEFRDGQSYSEQEQRKELVEYSDIASLKVGECFLLLPVPEVRVSRITVPNCSKG